LRQRRERECPADGRQKDPERHAGVVAAMTVHRNVRDHTRMTLWIFLAAISGTFAFASLTESRSYIIVGFVSAGLVCLVGFGMRVVRMPWPLTMAVQVVVLFWWTVLT